MHAAIDAAMKELETALELKRRQRAITADLRKHVDALAVAV